MNKNIVSNRLFIGLSFSVFLLLIFGTITNYLLQHESIEHNTNNYIENYKDYFDKTLINEVNVIHHYVDLIRENKTIINSFLEEDKKSLYENIKPFYDEFNKDSNITHLYFIDNNSKVFLRVHDYKKDKDIVNRYTLKKSIETNHVFHGLEFGIKKNFTLRLVHPWYDNNKLIGYIEMGKEIDKISNDLAENMNLNVLFAINKSVYTDASKDFLNKLKTKKQSKRFYISYSTIQNIDNQLLEFIESEKRILSLKIDGKNYIAHKHLLKDVSNKNLGYKIILIDKTEEYQWLFSQSKFHLILMFLGTSLILLFGYRYSKLYQKKLNKIFENLNQEKDKVEKLSIEQKTLLELFNIGDPVLFKWNNDKTGTINYVSNNVENLLSYSKNDFLEQKIKYVDCIHHEDLENVTNEIKKTIEDEKTNVLKHEPYRVISKNGEIKWILDYTILVRNTLNEINYMIGYIIDITKIKNLQNTLNEEKKLLKTILDSSNAIIATIDNKGVMTNINKYGCEFVGYSQREISSKPYFWFEKFIPSNVKPDIKTIINAIDEQGSIISTNTNPWIDKNGVEKTIEWSNSLLHDNSNNIQGIVTVGIDISEKDKKEQELLEEKNKFQQLLENATDGIHILDANGNIVECSNSFAEMLGYSKEEIIKLSINDWDEEFKKDEIPNKIKSLMKEALSFETKHKRKDGSIYFAQIKARGILINGKKYLYASVRDITTQKNAYKKLEKFIDLQDNMIILSDGFQIHYANRNFFKLTRYKNLGEFKRKYSDINNLFIENENFFYFEKKDAEINWIEKIQKLPDNQRVVAILGKNYNIHAFSLNINYFEDNLYIVTLTDISQTIIEKVNLKRQTLHDKLTDAYNREYFDQNCQNLKNLYSQDNLQLGVAFFDIDFFKLVNDNYGHKVGDEVLIEFVNRLIEHSRSDDKLIRWGGEEFIMLLKVKTKKDLLNITENLRKIIEENDFEKIGHKTCSIGATIHKENENIIDTINRADEAVYAAKLNGRNQVVIR